MKKTLQECKEIIASENKWKDFNEIIAYASNMDLLSLTDLANKMYYEQSEDESLKAENERLRAEIVYLTHDLKVLMKL